MLVNFKDMLHTQQTSLSTLLSGWTMSVGRISVRLCKRFDGVSFNH